MKMPAKVYLAAGMIALAPATLIAGDLFQAVYDGRPEEIPALVTAGADVNAGNPNGWTPLMVAASRGDLEAVKLLLSAGADPDIASRTEYYSGFTAVMAAAFYGHPEVAEVLVATGIELDAVDNHYYGETALMLAVKRGIPETVKVLLAGGADVNVANRNGVTALMYAASYGRMEMVEMLLAAGADPEIRDHAGLDASRWSFLAGSRRAEIRSLLETE